MKQLRAIPDKEQLIMNLIVLMETIDDNKYLLYTIHVQNSCLNASNYFILTLTAS